MVGRTTSFCWVRIRFCLYVTILELDLYHDCTINYYITKLKMGILEIIKFYMHFIIIS